MAVCMMRCGNCAEKSKRGEKMWIVQMISVKEA